MHHGRELIRKALDHAQPEGYQLKEPRNAPVLAPYKPKIDASILESEGLPRKQRYTGHKIYQLVRAEGYQGSEGNVHRYVGQQRRAQKHQQAFLPLEFEPGQDAQVDWGEVIVEITRRPAQLTQAVGRAGRKTLKTQNLLNLQIRWNRPYIPWRE